MSGRSERLGSILLGCTVYAEQNKRWLQRGARYATGTPSSALAQRYKLQGWKVSRASGSVYGITASTAATAESHYCGKHCGVFFGPSTEIQPQTFE